MSIFSGLTCIMLPYDTVGALDVVEEKEGEEAETDVEPEIEGVS